jgi:hypothetical protein
MNMETAEINRLNFFLLLAVTYQCKETLSRNLFEDMPDVRAYHNKESITHIERCFQISEPYVPHKDNSIKFDPFINIESS